VSGQFTGHAPTLLPSPNFIGAPSVCLPPKPCPETNFYSDTVAVPTLTHSFTNRAANELCLTVQLRFGCPGAPANALGAAAYLGTNQSNNPCANYLGDTGGDGTQPFSFRVPPHTNFLILVSARATNVLCPNYALELFGLPCPPPLLHITEGPSPNKMLLHWGTAFPGFRLQVTNALGSPGPGAFSNLAGPPVIVAGQYTVTNGMDGPQRFYRLTK